LARLDVDRGDLVVRLNALEKLVALRGDVRVPRSSVSQMRLSESPWVELRGIRAAGTGLARLIALGSRRAPGVHDFAAVYRGRAAVVIELRGASFDRLVVSSRRPDVDLARLAAS
jgi:hypothetical protein